MSVKSTELLAYAAIMLGVFGHATSEFVAVQTGLVGPEQSDLSHIEIECAASPMPIGAPAFDRSSWYTVPSPAPMPMQMVNLDIGNQVRIGVNAHDIELRCVGIR